MVDLKSRGINNGMFNLRNGNALAASNFAVKSCKVFLRVLCVGKSYVNLSYLVKDMYRIVAIETTTLKNYVVCNQSKSKKTRDKVLTQS